MLLLSGIPVADAIMLAGILSDGEWFTGHFFFEMSVESPPPKKIQRSRRSECYGNSPEDGFASKAFRFGIKLRWTLDGLIRRNYDALIVRASASRPITGSVVEAESAQQSHPAGTKVPFVHSQLLSMSMITLSDIV